MKSLRLLCLLALASLGLASTMLAQSPTITSVTVKDTACTYKVGSSTRQCSIGPGMTLIVKGINFGPPRRRNQNVQLPDSNHRDMDVHPGYCHRE